MRVSRERRSLHESIKFENSLEKSHKSGFPLSQGIPLSSHRVYFGLSESRSPPDFSGATFLFAHFCFQVFKTLQHFRFCYYLFCLGPDEASFGHPPITPWESCTSPDSHCAPHSDVDLMLGSIAWRTQPGCKRSFSIQPHKCLSSLNKEKSARERRLTGHLSTHAYTMPCHVLIVFVPSLAPLFRHTVPASLHSRWLPRTVMGC